MSKSNKIFFAVLSCLIIFLLTPIIKKADNVFADYYGGTSEIVMESQSKRVLYENRAREKKYMASTTKILTAITIIENCDVNDEVTVTPKTTNVEGSSVYLEAGEVLTVKDLLYGLMLRSGNDCAETLAVYCSNTIEAFAQLMNETAKRIGANGSNFKNPHGLHDDEHYTTAYDLALISCYAIKNPIFKEIVSTQKKTIPFTTKGYKRLLINKNKMLKNLDGCSGIKTGYTKKAGRCLVTSCSRNGTEVVCVVLNCSDMWNVSQNLIENAFSNYKNYKLIDKNNIVAFIPCEKGKSCPAYIKNDVILPLTDDEYKSLKIIYDYPDVVKKNTEKDKEIGKIDFYYQNNLLFSEKIYTLIKT